MRWRDGLWPTLKRTRGDRDLERDVASTREAAASSVVARGRGSIAPDLPVKTSDLLERGGAAVDALSLEKGHGNGDLFSLLEALQIGGPFTVESPWELRSPNGRHLVHAGGYAAVPFGEAYPPLVGFIEEYLKSNAQLGLPQQSASEWRSALGANLVALLASVAPSHAGSRVFLGNSGAEAIEAAMKMALAFRPAATKFINFERAYHGKTLGALALTPNEEYQAPFRPLRDVVTLPYGDAEAVEAELRRGSRQVAAIVIEPVQGEGGVVSPPTGYLRRVGELAREHGVLVIADEVQTGLGRTGHWFASVADGLEPDIVTLAKPLGGGMVPVGATIARDEVYRALLPSIASKRHSTTFGGGSLASAVALRSLELIVEQRLDLRARELGAAGLARLEATAAAHPGLISEARGAGMLFAVTLEPVVGFRVPGVPESDLQAITSALALRQLQEAGVHACYSVNASRVVRFTPPLNIPDHLFTELWDRVDKFADANPRSLSMLQRYPLPRLLQLIRSAYGR